MTGRGLDRVGAHAPGVNSTRVGVQFMLGGKQTPTTDQLAGFRALLSWLKARGVRTSRISGHRDHISTSCPGSNLYARVRSGDWGTGGSPGSTPQEDDVIGLKKGDKGERVKALQVLITYAGGKLPKYGVDGGYGAETAEALRLVRKSVGSEAGSGWGDEVTGWGYAQLMKAVAKSN